MADGDGHNNFPGRVSALENAQRDTGNKVASLETTMKIFVEEFRDHRRRTDDYRGDMKIVLAAQTTAMQGLGKQLEKDIVPLVNDYREKRAEARGAARLGRWIYGLIAAGVAGAVSLLLEFLKRLH